MRILRLRLRNYRGVADREIQLAPRGVTVVCGPNEIGKSSLAEAVDLLFDELDSTTKQRVRDVQPVDRDAGAEIEADVETGPYAFTYAKRFQRRARTRLRVTKPKVENWTGREAHQRVREILEETIDTELWRALRVQQGEGLVQASWLGRPALAAALDRAAGSASTAQEESLFEAVEREEQRYFTKAGRPRQEWARAEREASQARQRETSLAQELAELERDLGRAEELRRLRIACEENAHRCEQTLREHEERFEPVAALREACVTAEARRDGALAEEREAAQRARERSRLLTHHAAAEADLAQRAEEIEHGEPALLGARAELEHAERAFAEARQAREECARETGVHQRDLDRHRAETERLHLRERRQRLQATEAALRETRRTLAEDPIREQAVRQVRDAERAVERARSRVESEGPRVQLTPHAHLQAVVDGRQLQLAEGEAFEQRVAESLWLSVPGVADVTVVAGEGAAERVKELEQARTRLRDRCAELGVEDHADAVRRLAARHESEGRAAELEAQLEALLGSDSYEQLDARIRELEERIGQLEIERGTLFPLPADAETAQSELDASRARQERSDAQLRDAETRRDALRERHRQLAELHRETAVRLELAEQSFRDLDERLAAARGEATDEALQDELALRAARARTSEAEARSAAEALAAADPEGAEAALARSRREREQAARELARVRDEATHVAARLEVRGEAGLYERLAAARAEADAAERRLRSLARRAAAARRLLTTLREERETSREGYAEPLALRIEELGQRVFGNDFAVELDDQLRVARRIQHGLSLPFEQLSAGAREQIALLARLAVATLVADDGGAPLVIDDALGHSDPERLVRVGRALSEAAPSAQILVLTCTPERYRHVENARVVQLG